MGGICRLIAIPVSSFLRKRYDHAAGTMFVELKERDNIIDIDFLSEESGYSFKQPENDTGGGYETSILLKIAGLRGNPAQRAILAELTATNAAFIVGIMDNEDAIYLFGDPDNLISFREDNQSGPNFARNTLTITGSAMLIDRPELVTANSINDLL